MATRWVGAFVFLLAVSYLSGCGKYLRPLPPEVVSPAGVEELAASASLEGVKLTWRSPTSDLRGKDLKSLTGYSVQRRVLTDKQSEDVSETVFEQISFIEDHSVEKLLEAREAARIAGTPQHRAKVDDSLKSFEFKDVNLASGAKYVYRIVPTNDSGEGATPKLVRVLFRGDSSEVAVIESGELEEELLEDPFA